MTRRRLAKQRGSMILESGLVLVPLIFTILGISELGRALWTSHTLAMAIKRTARVAAVHGARCAAASTACPMTLGGLVTNLQQTTVGLDSSRLQLTFTAGSTSILCNPVSSCATNDAVWPQEPGNAVGQALTISGVYPFNFALSSLWAGQSTSAINLTSKSNEVIQF